MSSEIKIVFEEAEKGLSALRAAAEAIHISLAKSPIQNNVLKTVDVINELNTSLQSLVETYQALLQANEQAASDTVQKMKEVDAQIAASMK